MQSIKISGKTREAKGKCNQLRSKGYLPGVLYGQNEDTVPVVFAKTELEGVIHKLGENAFLEISINDVIKPVMIKEVQRDPVSNDILHVDFQTIFKNKKIHTIVPVKLKGANNIERKGGILQHQLNHIEVEGLSENIPKYITADVTDLFPGHNLQVSDLEFSSEISILTPLNEVVVTVLNSERQNGINDEKTDEGKEEKKEEVK